MDLLTRDPNTEQRDGEAGSLLICEGFSRWSLTDMVSLTRLGLPEVEQDMEWWKIHFTRSEAFCFNPSLLMTGCMISCTSHTSLDLNFQIRKMPIRNVRLIQWFSNSSLPRIYLWNFSYLPSCCENVWLSNKKNHKKIVSQSSITTSKVHWQHDVTDDKH